MGSTIDTVGARGNGNDAGYPAELERAIGGTDTEVTRTDVFGVLANERRRKVIRYLLEGDARATVGELAEFIAADEMDIPQSQLSSSDRKRVYVSLYQNHLPKMDSSNVVDFDGDRKTVALRETAPMFESMMDLDRTNRVRRWTLTGAVAVTGVVVTGTLLGVVSGLGSAGMWAALGIVGLVAIAATKAYYRAIR